MRLRGRGHRETAAAWRQQQRLAALRAECLAAPGHELLPLRVAHEVGKALNTLSYSSKASGNGDGERLRREENGEERSGSNSDGEGSGSGESAAEAWGAEDEEGLVAAAADHLRLTVQQLGGGQFVVSLAHAHLFLAWEELRQCVLQSAGAAQAMEGSKQMWAEADFLGPAAGWRLSTRRYGAMLCALGWEPLLLDALLWLPHHGTHAQQLLAALARDAPAAAVAVMRLLPAPGQSDGPYGWWAALLQGLCLQRSCQEVRVTADRVALLTQLAEAAVWALSAGAAPLPTATAGAGHRAGGNGLSTGAGSASAQAVAAAALPLLEQLLAAWPNDLSPSASLVSSLRALQPLLQAAVATRTNPGGGISGSGPCGPAAAALEVATLVHANTRIMLCLMAWPAAAAGGAESGADANQPSAVPPQLPAADAGVWELLLKHPAQPEAIWRSPGTTPPWQFLLQRGGGTSSGGAAGEPAQATPAVGAGVSSSLLQGIIAQVQRASGGSSSNVDIGSGKQNSAMAPLLQLGSSRGTNAGSEEGATCTRPLEGAAAHCLALACAWLTPGAPCWWQLPLNRTLRAAAGADPFAAPLLLAALLDMLAHTHYLGSSDSGGSATLHPWAPPLLLALAAGVGAEVAAPEHQAALLTAAYAPPALQAPALCSPTAMHASAASRRLAGLQEALWMGDANVKASAAAGLVSISNRLIARDESGEEVVPSREQQARAAAEAARSLLPHALLWPRAVLQRLLRDGIEHRAQQPVILEVLGSLAPLCRSSTPQMATLAAAHAPTAPTRLLGALQGQLLGGTGDAGGAVDAPPAQLSASERAAAAQLVRRLLSAKLLDAQETFTQLVAAPLAEIWGIYRNSSSSSGGSTQDGVHSSSGGEWRDSGSHQQLGLQRLRTLLDLSEVLLGPSPAAAVVLSPTDRWCVATGLCAVAERLAAGESGGSGGGVVSAPDLSGLSQTERLLAAVAALSQQQRALSGAERQEQQVDPSAAAADLAALPWERRLALIPLLDPPARGPEQQKIQDMLQPPPVSPPPTGASDDGLAAGVAAVRQALAFAASSDAHAELLAQQLAQGHTATNGLCSNSTGGHAEQVAGCVAVAVSAVPSDALRRALLLALGEMLPRSTEAAGARALQVALPALLAARLQLPATTTTTAGAGVGAGASLEPAALARAAALQLACRGVALYLDGSAWARAAPAAVWRQAAEQCCRHVNGMALLLMGPATEQQQQQQQQAGEAAARHDAACLCLRECCRLAAALPRAANASPLRALLLHTLTEAARPPVALARQVQNIASPTDGLDGPDCVPPPPPAGLASVVVRHSSRPFADVLAAAAREVALTPAPLQAVLLPALAHVGAATAAAALLPGGSGAPPALQDEVEGAVEAAVAAAEADV